MDSAIRGDSVPFSSPTTSTFATDVTAAVCGLLQLSSSSITTGLQGSTSHAGATSISLQAAQFLPNKLFAIPPPCPPPLLDRFRNNGLLNETLTLQQFYAEQSRLWLTASIRQQYAQKSYPPVLRCYICKNLDTFNKTLLYTALYKPIFFLCRSCKTHLPSLETNVQHLNYCPTRESK